jgi:hypothetical protein
VAGVFLTSPALASTSATRMPGHAHRPWRIRAAASALVVLAATGLVSGCGDDAAVGDPAEQLSDFRSRAAAGADASYTATYDLTQGDAGGNATVAVAHTPTDLRLDITTESGVTTSITTSDGTVACQSVAKAATTCLQVAAAGKEPPTSLNPGLRAVFTTTLDKLGQGFGTVEILGNPTNTSADVLCGRVTGNDVTNGLYCLLPTGVIDTANFSSGSLDLTGQQGAPTDASFTPPASPRPVAQG